MSSTNKFIFPELLPHVEKKKRMLWTAWAGQQHNSVWTQEDAIQTVSPCRS